MTYGDRPSGEMLLYSGFVPDVPDAGEGGDLGDGEGGEVEVEMVVEEGGVGKLKEAVAGKSFGARRRGSGLVVAVEVGAGIEGRAKAASLLKTLYIFEKLDKAGLARFLRKETSFGEYFEEEEWRKYLRKACGIEEKEGGQKKEEEEGAAAGEGWFLREEEAGRLVEKLGRCRRLVLEKLYEESLA